MDAAEFLFERRHLTGDAAWDAYVALGGDGLGANHSGWVRRSCPAHESRSGNSLAFKLDETQGMPVLVIFDHAGCSPREILEAAGVDTTGLADGDGEPIESWLRRGATRPASFPTLKDDTSPVFEPQASQWLKYFADKRGMDVDVLRSAGVTIVQHPYRRRADQPLHVRARFPFTVDGQLVGAWDRQIVDTEPGGRRWVMSGGIPVPFGWDSLDRSGHVYLVEGPTDAVALRHALPDAAILGVGSGRGMWRPWWGAEIGRRFVWLFADNDGGGENTRRTARAVLEPHALDVHDVRIPGDWNDVDDWRRAAGPQFRDQTLEALKRSVQKETR